LPAGRAFRLAPAVVDLDESRERKSATVLETIDVKERLEVVSAQRDAFDSENRSLKAELQKKDAMPGQMSSPNGQKN
jgi:hypothetical protein